MADFKIVKPEPFIVEGIDGDTYELPRIKDLSAEQVAAMGDISEAEKPAERVSAVKAFILMLCPGLGGEPLTDMGYLSLFSALADGSDVTLGEF